MYRSRKALHVRVSIMICHILNTVFGITLSLCFILTSMNILDRWLEKKGWATELFPISVTCTRIRPSFKLGLDNGARYFVSHRNAAKDFYGARCLSPEKSTVVAPRDLYKLLQAKLLSFINLLFTTERTCSNDFKTDFN